MPGIVHKTTINDLPVINDNTLFVFALTSEAADAFEHVNKLICGVGKVNAAYELTRAIYASRPSLIINLGSAGSNFFSTGEVVCCTQFVQRDMDVQPLGFALYETPLSGIDPVLNYGIAVKGLPHGVCGSGDNFEVNHSRTEYNVIDMEAYPLALIAMKEQIPFLCLKYISDGADGAAVESWPIQVHKAAAAFESVLFR